MIVDKLKESILDSAFKGLLGTNNSIESKEKCTECNDKPYNIPDNWVFSKMKDVCISVYDGSHNPPPDSKIGIPILSAKDVYDHKINIGDCTRCVLEDDYEKENKKVNLEIGDVLLTIVGTIGRTAIIENSDRVCFQRSVAILKPNNINSKYLMFFLESPYCKEVYRKEAKGTVQLGFYLDSVKKITIPVPPLEEQKRIVNKIELLFSKLDEIQPIEQELNELKNNFTNKIKTSILVYLMKRKLGTNIITEKKVNINSNIICDEIPSNWLRIRSKDILNITTGKKDANYGTEDGLYDFYTCASIPIKAPTYSFEGKNLILPGNGANVGLTIYCEDKFEAYQRTYIASPKYDDNIIDLKYVYYYYCAFWSDYNKNKMFGSAIPYIKLGNLENFEINIPPLEEQKRIINIIEELLPLCDNIEKLINE